jgi:hypothetical protein
MKKTKPLAILVTTFLALSMVFAQPAFADNIAPASKLKPLFMEEVGSEAEFREVLEYISDGDTITLTSDITLSDAEIIIPLNTTITLAGNYQLIGASNKYVINVKGKLVLDGATITHAQGSSGGGIYVSSVGELIFESGKITNNHAVSGIKIDDGQSSKNGGGVYSRGTFTMNGGEISNNKADGIGGGVYSEFGSFVMNAGTITDNEAVSGAGVFGGFTMNDGTIAKNVASDFGGGVGIASVGLEMNGGTIAENSAKYGGGVSNSSSSELGLITINAGTISDNNATNDGGGIFTRAYDKLKISKGAIFSNNKAAKGELLDEKTDLPTWNVYKKGIKSVNWSEGASVGFNNNDINYAFVKVMLDYNFKGSPKEKTIKVPKGVRLALKDYIDPYSLEGFKGHLLTAWTHDPHNVQKADMHLMVVDEDVTLYAQWEPFGFDLTVNNSYAKTTGEGEYVLGDVITIHAGEREGYDFAGWTIEEGEVTLADPKSPTTTFTAKTAGYGIGFDNSEVYLFSAELQSDEPPTDPSTLHVYLNPVVSANWKAKPAEADGDTSSLPATGDSSALMFAVFSLIVLSALVCFARYRVLRRYH